MTRRDFLVRAAALTGGLGKSTLYHGALSPLAEARSHSSYAKEWPDMLLAYLSGELNALSNHWDQERARMVTSAQIEARNRFVRGKFLEMVGGLPERTSLNPLTVRSFERDGYRVENVMFQSRPDFWVTGNLYIPMTGKPPYPGIISPTGHDPLARMDQTYQCAYINLAKNGFAVLAYDPIGQGERRYYWDPVRNMAEVSGDPIFEHSMPGQLLLLMGENLTQYRIWDGIRAIDYLLTRAEVDKQRIGCAGHSGGGTLTLFITALDERVKCAVLNEGGGGQRWPIRFTPGSRVGPADVEQNLFPAALFGIDQEDLRIAIAPRPLLVTIENYYPDFEKSRQRVLARYRQLGAPDRFETTEADDPHSWTMKLRLATTTWFCKWFYGRKGPAEEPVFGVESPELLYCASKGSLRYSHQGETIFSLIHNKATALPPKRKHLMNATEWEESRQEVLLRIGRLLHCHRTNQALGVRKRVTTERKGYRIEKLEFMSEPGIYIPAWVFVPAANRAETTPLLYVSDGGKESEGMEFGVLESLTLKGNIVVAVDVRGIGETTPLHDPQIREGGEFGHLFDVETAFSYMAWWMDQSLLGMRVQDVMRSVDYALSRCDVDRESVRMVGRGMGALWVLFAAALDRRIHSVICEGGLLSYQSLASADRYIHGANVFIRDVLLHFDLPDVAGCVADRNLVLLAPVDAMGKAVDLSEAKKTYQRTDEAYAAAGSLQHFQIVEHRQGQTPADDYLSLLKG